MVGPVHLEAEYLATLRSWRATYPCFLTHIGLDNNIPTEVLRQAHGYYWNDWDAELVGRNGLCCKIFVPTLYEPALARHGGHVVIVQKVLDLDYEAIADWAAHKTTVERYLMAHLERTIPGFHQHVVAKASASALTSHRYTLNYQGAMLGWEMSPEQLGAHRFDVVGPIDRLYFVGHWVQPGGGITPVIVSAVKVANLITKGSAAPRGEIASPYASVPLNQPSMPIIG
jgi:prolycopene isomerase